MKHQDGKSWGENDKCETKLIIQQCLFTQVKISNDKLIIY